MGINPTHREEQTIRAIWKHHGYEDWATKPINDVAVGIAQIVHDVVDGKIAIARKLGPLDAG